MLNLKLKNRYKKTKVYRVIFAASLCLLSVSTMFAQGSFTVTGKVTDSTNEPLLGVTILEKGSNNGVLTDMEGGYTIQVANGKANLMFSYIGMTPQSVDVDNRRIINITMKDDIVLDEVVVTALGIKRESKALGYAVASVDNKSLSAGREQNIMAAISGKVAGVDISTGAGGPTGSTRVLIRGNSQLVGSNLPLYVIDGLPVDNTEIGSADKWGGYDYGDVLNSLNPDDIENITILKGPSASALYGSRASNGVVLITTKSGAEKKGLGIEVNSNVSIVSLLTKFDDYQRVYGQGRNGELPLEVANAENSSQTSWGAKLDPNLNAYIYNGEQKNYRNVANNILSFFDTGVTFTNSAAITNSNDNFNFRMSYSNTTSKDIVPNSTMDRNTFTFKGSTKLGKKIQVEAQATYSQEGVENRPALSDSPSNIGNSLIGLAPNFDQKWLSTGYKDEYGNYNQWNGNDWRLNPYWVINEMENKSTRNRLMGQMKFNYSITNFLKFSFRASTDYYTFKITEYVPPGTPKVDDGSMTERRNTVYENNYEAMLRYNQKFGDFDISGMLGGNIMQYDYESFIMTGTNEVNVGIKDIQNYATQSIVRNNPRKEVRSVYGQVNLGYKSLLYLDITGRNDVSSTLHPDLRSYFYPSVSGSFIFSELIKENTTWLTYGKLRASWAKVGGDTSPYQLSLEYGLKDFTLNGIPLGQISSNNAPKWDLKPTSTYSTEIGLEMKFLNNRLGFDLTLYQQRTVDQILALSLSKSTGYNNLMINAGEITNKGIELAINATPIQTKNFDWKSTFTFAQNVNKINELHEDLKTYTLAEARWANSLITATEGEAYGVIMGKKFARTENGDIIYANGLPTYEEELSILGNGNYDYTMGFSNVFTYKDFSLSVLLDMKFGADIYSMSMMNAHVNGTAMATLEGREEWYASEQARLAAGESVNNWNPTGGYLGKGVKETVDANGNVSYVPNDVYVNPQNYWSSIQENTPEPFIYDNSYIKLRELSFGYSLPKKILKNTPFTSVTASVYGRNLWLIYTNLKNVDPESTYNNGNGKGFEYGSLPSRRTFGFNLNVKF